MRRAEVAILATFPLDYRLSAERMNEEGARLLGTFPVPHHSHYVLDNDHVAVPVGLGTWSVWLEIESRKPGAGRRRVGLDEWQDATVAKVCVSTVFLGLDHSWPVARGIARQLFETMVFFSETGRDGDDQGQWRYSTWAQAVAGHAVVLARTRAYLAGGITRAEFDVEAES